jgi:hypothetical protein
MDETAEPVVEKVDPDTLKITKAREPEVTVVDRATLLMNRDNLQKRIDPLAVEMKEIDALLAQMDAP